MANFAHALASAPAPGPQAPIDPNDSKTIKLMSSEGSIFETTWVVIKKSNVIKNLVEVLEWMEHHKHEVEPEPVQLPPGQRNIALPEWDQAFFDLDQSEVFQIILPAYYLDIKRLLDFGCQKIASMIKGKSAEDLRSTFNLVNDFTPEEEERIRRENAWCDD